MRYAHWLRPRRADRWPAWIIAVDCDGLKADANGRGGWRRERLERWAAVLLSRRRCEYAAVAEASGPGADGWWRVLAEWSARPGLVWLASYRCPRVWALLGLWEALEAGRVELPMPVPLDQRPRPAWLAAADAGCCVLDDPPSMLRLRWPRGTRAMQWVGAENYGLERPASTQAGMPAARCLGTAVRGIARALQAASLGSLRPTAASQAYYGFRRSYYSGGVYCHGDPRALALEDRAYRGGRCEAWVLGHVPGPLWYLDYRSLYPSICATEALPVRLLRYHDGPLPLSALRPRAGQGVIARVLVESDEPAYPCRRVAAAGGGAGAAGSPGHSAPGNGDTDIIYPVGRWWTSLAGPELADALDRDRVRGVAGLAVYDLAPALADYARAVYALRCRAEVEGDRDVATLAKMLLVCLPGQFAARERRWVLAPRVNIDLPYAEWWGSDPAGLPCRYRSIAWTAWRQQSGGWAPESVPSLAAWITSAGRVALLRIIRLAGWPEVHYCDTDGIITTALGYERLSRSGMIRPGELGMLEVRDVSDSALIRGPKSYTFGDRDVRAGRPCLEAGDVDGVAGWFRAPTPAEQLRRGQRPEAISTLHREATNGAVPPGRVAVAGRAKPIEIWEV